MPKLIIVYIFMQMIVSAPKQVVASTPKPVVGCIFKGMIVSASIQRIVYAFMHMMVSTTKK